MVLALTIKAVRPLVTKFGISGAQRELMKKFSRSSIVKFFDKNAGKLAQPKKANITKNPRTTKKDCNKKITN